MIRYSNNSQFDREMKLALVKMERERYVRHYEEFGPNFPPDGSPETIDITDCVHLIETTRAGGAKLKFCKSKSNNFLKKTMSEPHILTPEKPTGKRMKPVAPNRKS